MGYHNCNPIVEEYFLEGKSKKYCNAETDGKILLLFGNRIAEWRDDGLWINNCGYKTNTTKNHLNKLPNVSIYQKNHKWYLNDKEWDGGWIKISGEKAPEVTGKSIIFDTSTRYIKTDGWRGREEPVYAICGANDTGMWEDSPCKTDECLKELELAKKAIGDIPSKFVEYQSSNVFCIHRYLIVPPSLINEARSRFNEWWGSAGRQSTYLLYKVSDD